MSLVVREVATYKEIRTFWDLDEVFMAHEILDMRDDVEEATYQEMRRKQR